jgi:hypothetical protein
MASTESKRSIRLAQLSAAHSHPTKTSTARNSRNNPRKRVRANTPRSLRKSHRFEEVGGKTVDFVEFFSDGDYHCVDVRFRDKTSLTLEIEPTFVVKPEHSDWKTGNLRPLKHWPLVHSQRL